MTGSRLQVGVQFVATTQVRVVCGATACTLGLDNTLIDLDEAFQVWAGKIDSTA
ncbi:hypothetical protein SAMN05216276_110517 [Streptosporangium subroseum]|uniref:Uncharacterized protein n=1 Tax=Streptosporangium subroseum TaxID=106412 RepID=A0A239P9V5_9ACTN|nr:hypothetical protein SAMN05216276_110517 [Streptosporangium subroseum]